MKSLGDIDLALNQPFQFSCQLASKLFIIIISNYIINIQKLIKMVISNYRPQEPQEMTKAIRQLFLTQQIRNFKTIRPIPVQTLIKNSKKQVNQHKDLILKDNINVNPKLKNQIISKLLQNTIDWQKERQVQKMLNLYLINYFHKSNKLQTMRGIPGDFSVIQSIDEGSYPEEGGKKDYPHYSNVIQSTQIPRQRLNVKRFLKPKLQKQTLFEPQTQIIFKIKTVYKILAKIIRIGNDDMELIANTIETSTRTVKLIYDLLSDFYKLQKQMRPSRGQESKGKLHKFIKQELKQMFQKFKNQQMSSYIPLQQNFITLAQFRSLLTKHIEQ